MKTLHRVKGLVHDLVVTRDGTVLTLWSPTGVRHTVLDLGAPHLPGLEYARNTLLALAFSPEAESALVLGLGGGSIPRMLLAAKPSLSIDVVEIDPVVLKVARRFFEVGERRNFRIYLDDAAGFLARCRTRYDIVILDAYMGETMPPQCTTLEFFRDVRCRLSEKGVLAVNCMTGDKVRYRTLLSIIEAAIGQVSVLHGRRSHNIVAFAPVGAVARRRVVDEARTLATGLPFATDLTRMTRRLYLFR